MKKLYIETYGCQMNVADSEVVASVMRMAGYEPCATEAEADAVFLNTCSVRDNAEQKILHRLETLTAQRRKGRRMIVGVLGCMAERVKDDLLNRHGADLVAGPDAYLSLPDLVAQAETGHKAIDVALSTTETYRDVVPERYCGNRLSGFVSITRGCNNFCHYCIVPYTRGRERSRDVDSILREVRDLAERGYREVTLLGQNVNSYRWQGEGGAEVDFPALLRRVAQAVPTLRVRFTTSHPKDMSDATLHVIAEEPNVCRHIHLPVQSGSDRILRLMNRKYTRAWYLDRVAAIRRIVLPEAFLQSFVYQYLFGSSIYVGVWSMLAGFVIVPVVSLLQKKDAVAEARLEELFRPFSGMSEAVEQAADFYLEDHASAMEETEKAEEKVSSDGDVRS